jgi:hypothetical protein
VRGLPGRQVGSPSAYSNQEESHGGLNRRRGHQARTDPGGNRAGFVPVTVHPGEFEVKHAPERQAAGDSYEVRCASNVPVCSSCPLMYNCAVPGCRCDAMP